MKEDDDSCADCLVYHRGNCPASVVFGVKVRSLACASGDEHCCCQGETHDMQTPPKWVGCECWCHQ